MSPARLLLLQPGGTPRSIDLMEPGIQIGRAPERELRLRHPGVSRLHAELRWIEDSWNLIDRESRNGSWVSGRRAMRQRLRSGDLLCLGPASMLFLQEPTSPSDASEMRAEGPGEDQVSGHPGRASSYTIALPPPVRRSIFLMLVFGVLAGLLLLVLKPGTLDPSSATIAPRSSPSRIAARVESRTPPPSPAQPTMVPTASPERPSPSPTRTLTPRPTRTPTSRPRIKQRGQEVARRHYRQGVILLGVGDRDRAVQELHQALGLLGTTDPALRGKIQRRLRCLGGSLPPGGIRGTPTPASP